MRFRRFLKNHFFAVLFGIAILAYGVRIYWNQDEHLAKLAEEKQEREVHLEYAKDNFDKMLKLEEQSNTSESKETQIRERLNMIKKDEIQFLFSKEN
ncbi:MAG: hypothetical protein Q4A72_02925 [Bacillota bacterium]|nr:hypothetical protein [Bacillota bacterium]